MFAELLGRSCFSFLRGASQPEEMVEQAQQFKLSALALCDRDGLYGAARALRRAEELQQRLVVGAELTLTEDAGERPLEIPAYTDTAPVLSLLVENQTGYTNLCRLLTLLHADRPKGQGALALQALHANTAGLVAVIPAPRVPGGASTPTSRTLAALKELFGGRCYLAMYRHWDGFDAQRLAWVQSQAAYFGLPIVASARPNFHARERKPLADILHCVRHGITLDRAGTSLGINSEAYLRSEAQMLDLFADHPEWVELAGEVAAGLSFKLNEIRYQFPCHLEPGESADDKLRRLTLEGLARRYPGGAGEAVRSQVESELKIIAGLEVAPYFLSTWEVVEIARRRQILCQGRGSAANSAVCYALGITAVDPTRSNLLFARFLSIERHEPPDIDIDFEHERREEVIQEIYERYGRDRAAMVSEVICYRGKSALREVGKVFGLSLEQVDRLSGTITHWDSAEVGKRRLKEAGLDALEPRLQLVLRYARELQGFPRHLSIHVGGFVLSSEPLCAVAPIQPARMPGRTVIPWDKDDIETLGFFKVDVLGLGMLTAIRKTLELVHAEGALEPLGPVTPREPRLTPLAAPKSTPAEVASMREFCTRADVTEVFDPLEVVTRIPGSDPSVYEKICQADVVGVFQIESRAQMAMLPRLQPRSFYDLVIEVSIVRPGPIQGGMVHPYLRRRKGNEAISFPHPDMQQILERTLGVPLFQEQVMQIAIVGAGYTGGEADQLRRDMAAWKKSGRLLRHRQRLLQGFAKKGIQREFGEALFEQIKGFGDYGFPESHASSFAVLVYTSAWLKTHYPAHFGCALINSQPMGFYSRSTIVQDMQRHGVEVRDVSLAESRWDCTLEDASAACQIQSQKLGAARAVRLGFRNIKGFGEAAARRIEQARAQQKFANIEELVRRAKLAKNEIEALAEAGALEGVTAGRRQALWAARAPRLPGLFAEKPLVEASVRLPALHAAEQLVLDYERKGLCVTDHPLRHLRKRLKQRGVVLASQLAEFPKGASVKVAGLVLSRQQPGTASGVVFITLEDETGFMNLILYQRVFEKFHTAARHSTLLWAKGVIEREEQAQHTHPVIHVIVRELRRLDVPGQQVPHRSRDFH